MAQRKAAGLVGKIWDPDAKPITNPVLAMQRLAGRLQAAVDVLGERLDEGNLEGTTATAWAKVLRELRQVLTDMERLKISQRALELRAAEMQVIVSLLDRALSVAELEAEVRAAIARAFFAELRAWVRGQIAAPDPAALPGPGVDGVQHSGADSGTMNP